MIEQATLEENLYHYFGYKTFRTGQRELVEEVLNGNDVLGILPTGSGKSLCYQLPAKLMKGTTIVVSPLISLMIDQVNQLKANHFKKVTALNSFMNPMERRQIYRELQTYDLIYVSPELLQQDELIRRLKQIRVPLFVIDEAHCISQWGHEFRPDYLKLGSVIRELNDPVIMALSATATKEVQQDIVTYLKRPNMVKHIFPMDRENIVITVKKVDDDQEKIALLRDLFKKYTCPAIIYFSSRHSAETTAQLLREKLPEQRIAFYHGGMEQMDRIAIQQQFMHDQLDIICCTSAFGMGINKSNIRLVVHFHLPPQLESYIQEIGRAGRDGEPSIALLLYANMDKMIPTGLIRKELPSRQQLEIVVRQLELLEERKQAFPSTEEAVDMFQLNETQWRFLRHQIEKHGMIEKNNWAVNHENWQRTRLSIQHYMEERVSIKERKLMEMIQWTETQGCLRKHLYQHFQDSYSKPLDNCCSNCGFSYSVLQPVDKSINTDVPAGSWWEKLQKLLLAGGNYA
ncbi:ATP-dependent DNA helicase RecQ [Lentibacillus sp. L22]|uniref:RecQ family ATP-dependent DNA helicase n=1 Tax=Lentibacillus TaxID=175304 RepID=UPI0022B189D4|nr:ATP-dependent DNA helicase RecQ [Lentibacillus daqui]